MFVHRFYLVNHYTFRHSMFWSLRAICQDLTFPVQYRPVMLVHHQNTVHRCNVKLHLITYVLECLTRITTFFWTISSVNAQQHF